MLAFASDRYVGARIGIHNPAGERVGTVGRLRNLEYLLVAGDRDEVRQLVGPWRDALVAAGRLTGAARLRFTSSALLDPPDALSTLALSRMWSTGYRLDAGAGASRVLGDMPGTEEGNDVGALDGRVAIITGPGAASAVSTRCCSRPRAPRSS